MGRAATIIWALLLGIVLAASPALADLSDDRSRQVERPLPAEIEESLSESKVEERNRAKTYNGAGFLCTAIEAPNSHRTTPHSRVSVARIARRDDPTGSLTHGLRAPPA